MLCLTKLDRRITAALVRIDEVGRVELVAAVVALVAARIRESANRTLAFDVSIGKRASGLRIERPHLRLLHQVALLIELQEESLRDAVVVARGGAREDVVGHAEAAQVLDDDRAVLIHERLRRDALLVRLVRDRRAVLVGAARHQHARSAQALKARQHICRHGESGQVADVSRAVRVRPGRSHENSSRHRR